MTELEDPLQVAETLDVIARKIYDTMYSHSGEITKYDNGSGKIRYDDADLLRKIAKRMRRQEYLRLAEENQ